MTSQIPKSVKGQSCEHSLDQFPRASCVWAEVKYDGERTQIHVAVAPDGNSNTTIFSKSGRDSTTDRVAVLDIVKSALGLSTSGPEVVGIHRPMIRNIVLEAEMVAYSTKRGKIDGK
jgi:DNA ligase-4